MLMKVKQALLVLVLGLQTAWILGTAVQQERALSGGTTILLETRPVDPRDLLRGDYVILNYKISDVPLSMFSPPRTNAPDAGETIYVALAPAGEFHHCVRASMERMQPLANEVVLKGKVHSGWGGPASGSVHVEYGLERYYVREGTGNPQGKLTVRVSVPPSGQAIIKDVLVNGKPYRDVMKAEGQ